MKTITPEQVETTIERIWTPDVELNTGKPGARRAIQSSRPPQTALVENDEYELITPLNLPGLIVSPRGIQSVTAPDVRLTRRPMDCVIETEDGDAASFCQLPGCLGNVADAEALDMSAVRPFGELEVIDEYAEVAAMQMPGRLIEQSALTEESTEHAEARGLCATCAYRDTCDFPRPTGGVWRCEEYA